MLYSLTPCPCVAPSYIIAAEQAAVQTAKNLGAVVRAFDVRPVCKEQVESMGATFLEVDIQEDGIRDPLWSRGLGDVYKRQRLW